MHIRTKIHFVPESIPHKLKSNVDLEIALNSVPKFKNISKNVDKNEKKYLFKTSLIRKNIIYLKYGLYRYRSSADC